MAIEPTEYPSEQIPNPRATRHRAAWLLAATFLAGAALRVFPLFYPSLWFDEIFTMSVASRPAHDLIRISRLDAHPALYYLLVHGLMVSAQYGVGFFHSGWLRLASLVPGLLTCAAGWWFARRAWGAERAGRALALLAFSPVLCHFSVELRDYSLLILELLLAGGCGFFMVRDAGRRGWLWCAGFCAAAVAALQTHNLAFVHLPAMWGLIVAGAFSFGLRRDRALQAFAALAIPGAALAAAWSRASVQAELHNGASFWVPDPHVSGFFATYGFHLPFGPLVVDDPFAGWPLAATAVGLTALAAIIVAAVLRWLRAAQSGQRRIDPFLVMAATMTVAPLVAAFIVHVAGKGPVFLPVRYNLVVAPFWCLTIAGLVDGGRAGNAAGRGIWAALIAISIAATLFVQRDRILYRGDARHLRELAPPLTPRESDVIVWNDAFLARWLPQSDGFTFWSMERLCEAVRRGSLAPDARVYLVRHAAAFLPGNAERSDAALLDAAMRMVPGIAKLDTKRMWMFDEIHEAEGPNIAALCGHYEAAIAAAREQKKGPPGTLKILPMENPVVLGKGWEIPELDSAHHTFAWSTGPEQTLALPPLEPGRYRARVNFWRPQPFPTPDLKIRARADGEAAWEEFNAPVGGVEVNLEFTVKRGDDPTKIQLEIPPWRPIDHIPGSPDNREIGMMLLGVEITRIGD